MIDLNANMSNYITRDWYTHTNKIKSDGTLKSLIFKVARQQL